MSQQRQPDPPGRPGATASSSPGPVGTFSRLSRAADVVTIAREISEQGLPPPEALSREALQHAPRVGEVAPEHVRGEVTRLLLGPGMHGALQWLHDVGALKHLLPELEATVDFSQEAGRRHKDVWEHTKQVVRQSVPRPLLRWAALLHDIGKVPTRVFTKDGKVTFHGHAEVGARMFDDVGRRLGFDRPFHKDVRFLILHHLRANQYDGSWTDSAVRRFDREMGCHLGDLLDLSRADITSKRPGRRQEALRSISDLAGRIEALRAEDAVVPPLPSGIGDEIMQRFKLPPSKLIGVLKQACEEAVASGEIEPHHDAAYYCEWLVAKDLVKPG